MWVYAGIYPEGGSKATFNDKGAEQKKHKYKSKHNNLKQNKPYFNVISLSRRRLDIMYFTTNN